jgi:hypothetical protein
VNTQPIEHPVLQVEMLNFDCFGLTFVKNYKSMWIPVKVKNNIFYNYFKTRDGATIFDKSVLLQNILPFIVSIRN